MPRANRTFLPGYAWRITHRCHQREFLLKFGEDRRRWRHWLFEATKRYRLRVLNYVATPDHVHLLVLDQGQGEIAKEHAAHQDALLELLGVDEFAEVQRLQQSWINEALKAETKEREEKWSRALAVGSKAFIERIQTEGGVRLLHRSVESDKSGWQLREESAQYNTERKKSGLSAENAVYFEPFVE